MARGPRSLKQRFWWFDVVYPIALAAVLFTSLTYIVYQGQRQWRLAQQAERKLLEFSLKNSEPPPVKIAGRVLVVSADLKDIARLGRAPSGPVPDGSAAAYAQVVERLGAAGVANIFVHWDTEAHPQDEIYLLPLTETLKRLPSATKVWLVTSQGPDTPLPKALADQVGLLSEELSDDTDQLQVECSYVPDFKESVTQTILNELGEKNAPESDPKPWVSTQLSSVFPRFILHLSRPADLATVSFGDVLGGGAGLQGFAAAFVGKNQSGAFSSSGNGSVVRQARTIYDAEVGEVGVTGTPLHVFWGMIAQMYVDRGMVAVPSQRVIIATTVAFCVLITIVMTLFGGGSALGMFMVYVATGPYANALAVRHLGVYLPLFDSYYFGLSTFIVAGLQKLSVTAFQRWRLDAQHRLHAHLADLKGNFISLLSHNLNTPVAKMQGMLSLLGGAKQAGPAPEWTQGVRTAEELVTELEYSIRSVLVASALEEGATHETPRAAKGLADEFQQAMGPSLKRLGLSVQVSAVGTGDADLVHVPLNFDVRALTAAIGAATALFHRAGETNAVTVVFRVEETDAEPRERLIVELSSDKTWIDPSAERVLADPDRPTVRTLTEGASFFSDILAGLTTLAAKAYQGKVALHRLGAGGRLELTLVPARTLQNDS